VLSPAFARAGLLKEKKNLTFRRDHENEEAMEGASKRHRKRRWATAMG